MMKSKVGSWMGGGGGGGLLDKCDINIISHYQGHKTNILIKTSYKDKLELDVNHGQTFVFHSILTFREVMFNLDHQEPPNTHVTC